MSSKTARALLPLIAMASMFPDSPYGPFPAIRISGRNRDTESVDELLERMPAQCRARVRQHSEMEAKATSHTRHTLEQCVRFNTNNCRDDERRGNCGANCWLAKAERKGGVA